MPLDDEKNKLPGLFAIPAAGDENPQILEFDFNGDSPHISREYAQRWQSMAHETAKI